MNWETGYGDWIAEPIWDQLRVLPWLPGTALVLPTPSTRRPAQEIPVSPRTILKRQVAAAADAGFAVKAGSEFEFYVLKDSWECAGRERLAGPAHVRLLQRGLPPAPGDQGRAAPPPAAHPDDRGRRADRVQQGRGGQRPARGQHPLRPRPRVGRPERRLQARRQGDRLPQRLGHHVHGQARPPLDGLVGAPPHERLGRGEGRAADARDRSREAGARTGCRRSVSSSWPG